MKFLALGFLFMLMVACISFEMCEAGHHHHKEGHVKIKVWRGPSHGHKKHKHAPFGYHFSIKEH